MRTATVADVVYSRILESVYLRVINYNFREALVAVAVGVVVGMAVAGPGLSFIIGSLFMVTVAMEHKGRIQTKKITTKI